MPTRRDASDRLLAVVAAVSGVYDAALGLAMLFGRGLLVRLFAVAPPAPPIFADLNGLFLLAVAAGYMLPWRDPRANRGYLWIMGPGLKATGAVLFVLDHFVRHSPMAFLLFAVTDGTLALVTLWALCVTGGKKAEL